jgi:acetoin:2,6-dichlorophenolindophenol oxidoreductase subunit alpha
MVTKSKNVSVKQSGRAAPGVSSAAASPSNRNGAGTSNRETLRKLYASLLKCRLIGEQMQRAGNVAQFEFAIGEEAVAVSAAADLQSGDSICASPRDLAALVAGGVGLEGLLPTSKSLLQKQTHPGKPGLSGAPDLFASGSSSDPFTLGTGIALAHKLARKQHVMVAISREITSLEPYSEAFQMAVSQRLPIVYVIKNGAQGESGHPPHLQPVSFMAREGKFPGIVVDGQDVVAVWRVAQESIHRARNRGGPTLIDCRTEPARDPIAHLEHYMRKRSVWDEKWRRELEAKVRQEL